MDTFFGQGHFPCEEDALEAVYGYRCTCLIYGAAGPPCACEAQEDQPSEPPGKRHRANIMPAMPAAAAPTAAPVAAAAAPATRAPVHHPAPQASAPPAKRHKKRGKKRGGRRGKGGKPSDDFEVACAIERLVLDVATLDDIIPDPAPGSCGRCEWDGDSCDRCYFIALDDVIDSIPGYVASRGAGHAALVRGLRQDDPYRLPSLWHIPPPGGKCDCRCCAHPMPFATDFVACDDDACCGLYHEPAAWVHAVKRARIARAVARDSAPTTRPPRAPPRPATEYSDDSGDENFWRDSWDNVDDQGGWGCAPAWAAK